MAARGYWDEVGGEWAASHQDGLWRRCSDAIHAQWLERAAGNLPPGRLVRLASIGYFRRRVS